MSFDLRVSQYVQLRDKIKELDDAHKAKMAPMKDALDQLNVMLLGMLNQTGQDSAAVKGVGTAYRKTKASATIADAAAFRRFVIGGEHWDMLDWRANAPSVKAFIDENLEAPPGLNFTMITDVGVRRANGKD